MVQWRVRAGRRRRACHATLGTSTSATTGRAIFSERDSHGRIKRSQEAKRRFRCGNPCPGDRQDDRRVSRLSDRPPRSVKQGRRRRAGQYAVAQRGAAQGEDGAGEAVAALSSAHAGPRPRSPSSRKRRAPHVGQGRKPSVASQPRSAASPCAGGRLASSPLPRRRRLPICPQSPPRRPRFGLQTLQFPTVARILPVPSR